jgi:Flp pilus assembly protein TadB
MASRSKIRASDADREQIAERLRHATAEGRLLAHELEERLAVALRARTYGELDAVVADLPRESHKPAARRPGSQVARWIAPAVALAIAIPVAVALVVAIVVMITGVFVLWAVWVAIGWWFLGRRARRVSRRRRPYPQAGYGARWRSG